MPRGLSVLFLLLGSAAAGDGAGDARLREIAEKAYRTGTSAGPEHVAYLLQSLGATGKGREFAERHTSNLLLDALIRVGADVPGGLLEPFFQHHPEQVIILLAKDPKKNREVLLRLMRSGTLLQWMAIADILAQARLPGVAVRVLNRLEMQGAIHVLRGNMAIGVGGGGDPDRRPQERTALHLQKVEAGWPPYARYLLTDTPSRGDVFLAATGHAVFWRREECRTEWVEILTLSPTVTDARFCLDCLRAFESPSLDRLSARPRFVCRPETGDSVEAIQGRYEHAFQRVLDHLQGAGALTKEERDSVKLRIEWEVR